MSATYCRIYKTSPLDDLSTQSFKNGFITIEVSSRGMTLTSRHWCRLCCRRRGRIESISYKQRACKKPSLALSDLAALVLWSLEDGKRREGMLTWPTV